MAWCAMSDLNKNKMRDQEDLSDSSDIEPYSIYDDLSAEELSFFAGGEVQTVEDNAVEISAKYDDTQRSDDIDINDRISAHLTHKTSHESRLEKNKKTNTDTKSLFFIGLIVALLISATVAAAIVLLNITGKIDLMSVFSGDTNVENVSPVLDDTTAVPINDNLDAGLDADVNSEPLPVTDTATNTNEANLELLTTKPASANLDSAIDSNNQQSNAIPTPNNDDSQNTEMSLEEFMQESDVTLYRDTSE